MKRLIILMLIFAVLLASSVSAAATTCQKLDFNCDGATDSADSETIRDIFDANFNFEFTKEDINNIDCYILKSFLTKNYNFDDDILPLNSVLNAIDTINDDCACYWTPDPSNIAYNYANAGHNSILFLNGYYEKRLLCWEGKWRTPKYEAGWQDWFESEGPENWRIQITDDDFGDWSIVNSNYWGKKWIEEEGTCYWPLGTKSNPTLHDKLLFINGYTEDKLLCFNGEWYKTKHEDFIPFTSEQDVFPTQEGDRIGSWKNIDGKWEKIKREKHEEKTILPINSNAFCEPDWKCSGWSECSNNAMTRTCEDRNFCNTLFSKPIESTGCDSPKAITEKAKIEKINYTQIILWVLVALIVIFLLVIIINRL
ncbi:MAG: hypothetical protein AABX30_03135 [Nanoarchaeota archaeon]